MRQLALPLTMDMAACQRLYPVLLAATEEHEAVEIDADAVERIGTPAIQLLLSLHRSGRLRLMRSSRSVVAAFADSGFALPGKEAAP